MNSLDASKKEHGEERINTLLSELRTLLKSHPSILLASPLHQIQTDKSSNSSDITLVPTDLFMTPSQGYGDYDLIKFLLARNMNPTHASEMLLSTHAWRLEHRVDSIKFKAPPNNFRSVVGVKDCNLDLTSSVHPESWRLFVNNLGGIYKNTKYLYLRWMLS